MISVLFAVIIISAIVAIALKAKNSDFSLPAPPTDAMGTTYGPSFASILATVGKVILALALIGVVVVVALLLIDQHVYSLTS